VEGIVTLVNELQLKNNPFETVVMPTGITTDVSALQLKKAPAPRDVTLAGMFTLTKPLHR